MSAGEIRCVPMHFVGVPCAAFFGCAMYHSAMSFHPRLDLGSQDAADIILLDDNFSSARCLPQAASLSQPVTACLVKEQPLRIVPCHRLLMVWHRDGLQVPLLRSMAGRLLY